MTAGGPIRRVVTMTTTTHTVETNYETTVDEQAVEEFTGRLFELFTGGALSYLIEIGHRTGLFDAATLGPAPAQSSPPGPG